MAKGIDLSIFAKVAAEQGISLDLQEAEAVAEMATASAETAKTARAERLSEGDALLRSLHAPHGAMMKRCNYCGKPFSTNYCGVGSCSVACRKRLLEETYKVPWNPEGQKTWGDYEPPLVISAESVEHLYAWATKFVADYERLRDLVDQPADNPQRVREVYLGVDAEGYSTTTLPEDRQSNSPTVHPSTQDGPAEQHRPLASRGISYSQKSDEESERTETEESLDDILASLEG